MEQAETARILPDRLHGAATRKRRQLKRAVPPRVQLPVNMSSHAASHAHEGESPAGSDVVDPVCGMTIDRADSVGEHAYRGTTYYFCNPHCLEQFRADPERYLDPQAHAGPAAPPDAEYTCPMDPEVRQIGPGPCPK